jgi:(S)-mandelate dehydrogenase
MLPSVMDYRRRAQRRLPRLAFDYLEGGAEDGIAMARNASAYAELEFRPEVLVDVSECRLEVPLLGATAAMPAVVGPTGLNGLFWPEADIHLARAAHKAGLPFVLSTASTSLLEDVRAATPGELWLQLYVQRDRRIAEHLMDRAWQNGYTVLFLTVDVPVHGNRDHDKRNGFKLPLRPSRRLLLDLAAHPGWCWRMLRHGGPQLKNLAVSSNARENIAEQASALSRQMDLALTWSDVAWLRRAWRGRIVIKGIQGLADARRAHAHGVDGIVLSNHGGRQLESAPCPRAILPEVAAELGRSLEILVDGGVRRGSDIAKAAALGARAVLLGRAPLYGLAGRGPAGAHEVLAILRAELENTLRLLGRNRVAALDAAVVRRR